MKHDVRSRFTSFKDFGFRDFERRTRSQILQEVVLVVSNTLCHLLTVIFPFFFFFNPHPFVYRFGPPRRSYDHAPFSLRFAKQWEEREYILCRQNSNLVLYLSKVNQSKARNSKHIESYEIVFGIEETLSEEERERMPKGLVESLRIEEGVQIYRIYHTTGMMLLSPSEYAATTTTAESAYNRPDCLLFTMLDEILPTLHTYEDIMGMTHLEKVERAATFLLSNTITCLCGT